MSSPMPNLVPNCELCNTARHICPGCGEDIKHGESACAKCGDMAKVDMNEALAKGYDASVDEY